MTYRVSKENMVKVDMASPIKCTEEIYSTIFVFYSLPLKCGQKLWFQRSRTSPNNNCFIPEFFMRLCLHLAWSDGNYEWWKGVKLNEYVAFCSDSRNLPTHILKLHTVISSLKMKRCRSIDNLCLSVADPGGARGGHPPPILLRTTFFATLALNKYNFSHFLSLLFIVHSAYHFSTHPNWK